MSEPHFSQLQIPMKKHTKHFHKFMDYHYKVNTS